MVGLSATLRAEGKPTSTMVSLVVVSHEASVSFSEEGNFSVSWGCFATILLGRVVVRMNEEVHVNPQLIQESPPVIPVFPVVLTAPTGASFGVLILPQRWRTWTVSEPLGPSDIRGGFSSISLIPSNMVSLILPKLTPPPALDPLTYPVPLSSLYLKALGKDPCSRHPKARTNQILPRQAGLSIPPVNIEPLSSLSLLCLFPAANRNH